MIHSFFRHIFFMQPIHSQFNPESAPVQGKNMLSWQKNVKNRGKIGE